jgi:dynein heavy chain
MRAACFKPNSLYQVGAGFQNTCAGVSAQVMFTFNDWYKTPWDKINVDILIEETKKLAKDVKTLNKAVRNYEVFRLLEESLKAMLTSLPLVQV